ncbi:MAG TPA: UDP-N-acetylmuramate dehydrogenase [Candidatus Dormibacteraeota bacterium]|nr:UDP-N-acetylmuramate dehydrogenase [Candidatus Dormibacteraeota bacterium]
MKASGEPAQVEFRENVPLAVFSSYRIGGPARVYAEARSAEEVRAAVTEAQRRGLRLFVMGSGTNLLIDDSGFGGLVLRPNLRTLEANGTEVRVGAGILVSEMLDFLVAKGLAGLEWAGGLPGTVGGAMRGNAGAFGGEIKDVAVAVESFDAPTLEARTRSNAECGFGYRNSVFKQRTDEIILTATFALRAGDASTIARVIEEKKEYRRRRHPLEYPNVGSVFKNVDVKQAPEAVRQLCAQVIKKDPFPVIPTAFLLSEASLKGLREGGAMISPKHPNFIVNVDHARSADVRGLIEQAKETVWQRFSVRLEEEIQYVNGS